MPFKGQIVRFNRHDLSMLENGQTVAAHGAEYSRALGIF